MNRAERKAADRAEYEASVERARQASLEQRAQKSSTAATAGLAFGLAGFMIGRALDKKRIPPRPDRP
jgi:hypothetical protein